jgi:hypothetical protein
LQPSDRRRAYRGVNLSYSQKPVCLLALFDAALGSSLSYFIGYNGFQLAKPGHYTSLRRVFARQTGVLSVMEMLRQEPVLRRHIIIPATRQR